MKLDTFVPFGRPQAGSDIIRLNTELDATDNFKLEQQYQNRLESKAMS